MGDRWSPAVLDWAERVYTVDIFGPLDALRRIKREATGEYRRHPAYLYLTGVIDGRAIHEELGGLGTVEWQEE